MLCDGGKAVEAQALDAVTIVRPETIMHWHRLLRVLAMEIPVPAGNFIRLATTAGLLSIAMNTLPLSYRFVRKAQVSSDESPQLGGAHPPQSN
jgi:hypothetical protein